MKDQKMMCRLFLMGILWLTILPVQSQTLAIFGSSVANGTGDKENGGGYAGKIKTLMEAKGWKVVNVSKGGDNTVKITPRIHADLFPTNPDYVLIGLSLGNEGIRSTDPVEQERMFERFRAGILRIIDSIEIIGAKPVLVNCYAHGWFAPTHYQYTQKMNQWINQLPYPSVNVLGAIDNGAGNWAEGYENDPWHPNNAGHGEMYYAFVPTLLESIEAGKPIPERALENTYTILKNTANDTAPVEMKTDRSMHSFSTSFEFKEASEGALLTIEMEKGSGVLSIKEGMLSYQSSNFERPVTSKLDVKQWNYVTISHRHAQKETLLFLNGQQIGRLQEQLIPERFVLGGSGKVDQQKAVEEVALRNWTIHRAALTEAEAKALYYHQFIQSSLEVYIPFTKVPDQGETLPNEAQSLSLVSFKKGLLSLKAPEE